MDAQFVTLIVTRNISAVLVGNDVDIQNVLLMRIMMVRDDGMSEKEYLDHLVEGMVAKCADSRIDVILDFRMIDEQGNYCRLSPKIEFECVHKQDRCIIAYHNGNPDIYNLCGRRR